jgi:hypothetical protein
MVNQRERFGGKRSITLPPRLILLSVEELKMKHLVWIFAVLMLASPAWAAKKLTVQQLKDQLANLQQDRKTDQEVAAELKQVELTEELTRADLNKIVDFAPGKHTIEQVYVLEARSAVLPPPASYLPATPAPDAAAQKAILDKAVEYTAKSYVQLPHLTATKTTLRFQDNVEAIDACSGLVGCAKSVVTAPGFSNWGSFVHFISSAETPVVSEHGTETIPSHKDKTPWGANGMITFQGSDSSLGVVFQDAQAAGNIQWLRWELINGRRAAVYSFRVPITNSRLSVDACCFPKSIQTGIARLYTSLSASVIAECEAAPNKAGGATGNFQTITNYDQHFKATVPYHGEIFIDPETGVVVRLITQAEFKASDEVQQEDQRIDYGPVKVGANAMVLPVKTVLNTVVAPHGDSGAARFTTRSTLFISEYKNYQPAAR